MSAARARVVVLLGVAQTLAWASSYYLPAMLATSMARDLGLTVPTVFASFSAALIVSALLGPIAGRAIDRWGGAPVLMSSSLVFAAGLGGLATATTPTAFFLAWLVLGAGMGGGLYEAAFATLVRLWGHEARGAITGVTLFAGFASTVGWPLSSWLDAHHGWRTACWTWAALHLCVGLPLNTLIPRPSTTRDATTQLEAAPVHAEPPPKHLRQTLVLSGVFATTWFISTAMAAHLPRLLLQAGTAVSTAVLVGALIGPAQVGARLLEFGLLRRIHPLRSARLAAGLHPLGALLLGLFGAPAALVFGVLHGAGNGILTIAKGTLPLVVFGPAGYGQRQGLLMVPARVAQALAPWAFGLAIDRWGAGALWLSAMLGLLAFGSLFLLSTKPAGE